MPRFRKLPVEIEAVQFKGRADDVHAISELAGIEIRVDYAEPKVPVLRIQALEGVMTAQVNDWIIRGIRGEMYPCKPDIFAATYEPVG
jgi:hypothetical protein